MNSRFNVDFDGISLEATVTNQLSMVEAWINDIRATNNGNELHDIKPTINRAIGNDLHDIKPNINRATNNGNELHDIKPTINRAIGNELHDIKPNINRATNNGSELHDIKPTINRATNSGKEELLVGFHCEWYMDIEDLCDQTIPYSQKSNLLLLQFCVGSKCLLFHTQKAGIQGSVPASLNAFLCDSKITFVGVGVAEKLFRVQVYLGCQPGKVMDLGPLAARKLGRKELRRAGLEDLAKLILDLDIKKPDHFSSPVFSDNTSGFDYDIYEINCDINEFNYEQIKYGCVDCYAGFAVAQKLLEMD